MSLTTPQPALFSLPQPPAVLSSALLALNQCAVIYSGDVVAASEHVTKTAGTLLNLDKFGLWLLQKGETVLVEINTYLLGQGTYSRGNRLTVADYPDYFEGGLGKGVMFEDLGQTTSGINKPAAADPWKWVRSQALIEVPIYQRGNLVGVLRGEQVNQPRYWQSDEQAFVGAIAGLIALALECQSKQQLETAQQRQLRLEAIEREQLVQAWQESQRFIQNILDASTSILYVNDFASGQNIYVNRWLQGVLGYQPEDLDKLGGCFINQLVHEDERPAVADQRKQLKSMADGEIVEMEYRLQHRSGHWQWLLCRETIFQRDGDGQPTQIFGTATDITDRKQAEVALREANRELERLANIDGLTQVANRRFFDFYLQKSWEKSHCYQNPLTLILCDIDYFKLYNDAYGHQAGDACLQQVSQAIESAVASDSDLVARYGGEEFAIVLPNTTCPGAQRVANNIQQAVLSLKILHQHSAVAPYITVSLGIATLKCAEEAAPDALIAIADQCLYQAKYEGRNRYCFEII
ncbi:MAG: diguanylate cyclase [Cyanobacteria bacterium J06635_11]